MLLGDLVFLIGALFGSLLFRFGEIPTEESFFSHLSYFLPVFALWIVAFFMAGLYERVTLLWRRRLPQTLLRVQVINLLLAVLVFYLFIPAISPKTILIIFLVLSSVLLVLWRMGIFPLLTPRRRIPALLIGQGSELAELQRELAGNPRLGFGSVEVIDIAATTVQEITEHIAMLHTNHSTSVIIADLYEPKLQFLRSTLYNLSSSGVKFISFYGIYEDLFKRVPLVALERNWFAERIVEPSATYWMAKRVLDVMVASLLGIISVPFYVLAYVAILLDDGGAFFIIQERIGYKGRPIHVYKIRTMSRNDAGKYDGTPNVVTRVGRWLRLTRIDELPQLWNVLRGDLSLVGPRPELPTLVSIYEQQIPYYHVRHQAPPGLSGWAQIYQERHPHHREAVAETAEKLSYDLYYLRHRSFLLDLVIILKTVKALVSRAGV